MVIELILALLTLLFVCYTLLLNIEYFSTYVPIGNWISKLVLFHNNKIVIAKEKERLRKEHELFTSTATEHQRTIEETLPGLAVGCDISLCYRKMTFPFEHKHYFLMIRESPEKEWILHFSTREEDSLKGKIFLETSFVESPTSHTTESSATVTLQILKRINNILPATNFSYCLRNSEHLARYIFTGNWISVQMTKKENMRTFFENMLDHKQNVLIASLPSDLEAKEEPIEKVKLFEHVEMVQFQRLVTDQSFKLHANAYNILIIGPTGVGKTTMTNILFNQSIGETKSNEMNIASVTRKFQVLQGKYVCKDQGTIDVNVVDTMGLCDQYVDDEEAVDNLSRAFFNEKTKIDKVVIVMAGTIKPPHKEAMKNLLHKLMYPSYKDCFLFVYNKTEKVDQSTKRALLKKMGADLEVDIGHQIPAPTPYQGTMLPGFVPAGMAIGVNQNNWNDPESKNTIDLLRDRLLPHCATVLQSTKRMSVQEGCVIQ